MERWAGKIAVVTGASSGIGWCICKQLLESGMIVIGLARRLHLMEELKSCLKNDIKDNFYPRECDLTSLPSIKTQFHWTEHRFKRLNVLINNAGMAEYSSLLEDGNEAALKRTMDVNLLGAIFCIKEGFRLMKHAMQELNEECHIINVNSLLGHTIPLHIPQCGFNVYPVAKHALKATNDMLRRELYPNKLMRLSAISPGATKTNFGTFKSNADKQHLQNMPEIEGMLEADDVARGVLFILASPLHVTIADLIMVPSREQY